MNLARITENGIETAICSPTAFEEHLAKSASDYEQAKINLQRIKDYFKDKTVNQDGKKEAVSEAEKILDLAKNTAKFVKESDLKNRKRHEKLLKDGFLEFIHSEHPIVKEGEKIIDTYQVIEGKLVQSWEVVEDPEKYKAQIEALKADLTSSDFKVIKCWEATMAKDPIPYDFDTIYKERKAKRKEIERLQEIVSKL